MDPNEAWKNLSRAVADDDWQTAAEIAEALAEWIGKDGFPPGITGCSAFDRIVVQATVQRIAAWEVV